MTSATMTHKSASRLCVKSFDQCPKVQQCDFLMIIIGSDKKRTRNESEEDEKTDKEVHCV